MSLLHRSKESSQPIKVDVQESISMMDRIRDHKLAAGITLAGVALTAGLMLRPSGGEDSAQAPIQPAATAPANPSEQLTPTPEVTQSSPESKYSAEEQAALVELSAISLEDLSSEIGMSRKEALKLFGDYTDTPITRETKPFEGDPARDYHAVIINTLLSDKTTVQEKTDMFAFLGLSPVALEKTYGNSLKIANGQADELLPDPNRATKEGGLSIDTFRDYGKGFVLAVAYALSSGAEVPAVNEVYIPNQTDQQAFLDYWIGDSSQETVYNGAVSPETTTIYYVTLNGQLTHNTPPDSEDMNLCSYGNCLQIPDIQPIGEYPYPGPGGRVTKIE